MKKRKSKINNEYIGISSYNKIYIYVCVCEYGIFTNKNKKEEEDGED